LTPNQQTFDDLLDEKSKPELKDVTSHIVDSEHKSAPESDEGYPYIKTSDIENGRIDFDDVSYVDKDAYEEWTQRLTPEPGDIVITREAPVGRVGFIPDGRQICLGQRTVLIRPDPDHINNQFLRYILLTGDIQNRLNSLSTGSTVDHLNMSDLRSLELPSLPDLETQKKIGRMLSNFDEKIELSQKRSDILEEIAQYLFEYWFVDYGPYSLDKQSSDHQSPEGFTRGSLGEIAEINHSRIEPGDHPTRVFQHYSFSGYDEDTQPELEKGEEIKSAKYEVSDNTVLVSKLNPNIQRVWRVENSPEHGISSTEFVNLEPKTDYTLSFIYLLAKSNHFQGYLESHTTGTSGSHQRVKQKDILDYSLSIPHEQELQKFNSIVQPLLESIATSRVECNNLENLRDTLLPKLMSGEVRIDGINLEDIEVDSEV
jgi:type I restriction enzyme, S subunit